MFVKDTAACELLLVSGRNSATIATLTEEQQHLPRGHRKEMRHISKKWIVPLTAFFGVLSITKAIAQSPSEILVTQATDQATSTEEKPFDLAEKTENIGRLYKNDKNDTLQELWFLGRYHGQYHWTEASTGESDFYETRRFRLGAQAKMLRKLTMHAQMVSGTNIDPFYNGFTELWIQWAFTPEVALSKGSAKEPLYS